MRVSTGDCASPAQDRWRRSDEGKPGNRMAGAVNGSALDKAVDRVR